MKRVIGISLVALFAVTAVANAELIRDRLNSALPEPDQREVNNYTMIYEPGHGTDPIMDDGYVARTNGTTNPNNLKYHTGLTDEYFEKIEFSYFGDISYALNLLDANGKSIKSYATDTIVNPGSYWEWHKVTLNESDVPGTPYSGEYDLRGFWVKLETAGASTAGVGTVDMYQVPEPVTIALLGFGAFGLIRRRSV